MNRDKIKIVEFGMDDDAPSPSDPARGSGLKIKEFGSEPDDERQRVASPKDVGQIRIIEFGDDAAAEKVRQQAAPPERPRKPVGAIKIREFGTESEAGPGRRSDGGRKIKIMEFD